MDKCKPTFQSMQPSRSLHHKSQAGAQHSHACSSGLRAVLSSTAARLAIWHLWARLQRPARSELAALQHTDNHTTLSICMTSGAAYDETAEEPFGSCHSI